MSSPSGYWDNDEINPAVLNKLAAIKASQVPSTSKPTVRKPLANLVPLYLQAPPTKRQPNLLDAQCWIFPLNRPKRDYQFDISRHCLFDNALIVLPTGLGKTFIASVVMLNCKPSPLSFHLH